MTPIRVKIGRGGKPYVVSVPSWEKDNPLRTRRCASAVHALHIVRMLIEGSGRTYTLEASAATQAAFTTLCARAHAEIDAAIVDIEGHANAAGHANL